MANKLLDIAEAVRAAGETLSHGKQPCDCCCCVAAAAVLKMAAALRT